MAVSHTLVLLAEPLSKNVGQRPSGALGVVRAETGGDGKIKSELQINANILKIPYTFG